MENWSFQNLFIFIIFFLPGFISIKVYDLLIPGDQRDFSKSIFEVISYSVLNFGVLSWLIYINYLYNSIVSYPFLFIISVMLIFVIMPVLWPFLVLKIIKSKSLSKILLNPIHKPWDYVFNKREPYWIIVNLKDGRKIGGIYDSNSFASSYPSKEQIFLEQVWKLDENGAFIESIERTKGIIILGEDISSLELFQ